MFGVEACQMTRSQVANQAFVKKSSLGPVNMRCSRMPSPIVLAAKNKLQLEIVAVYFGSCKPQSCLREKDNYSIEDACFIDAQLHVHRQLFL